MRRCVKFLLTGKTESMYAREQAETEQVGIEINPSNMFSYKSSITLTEFANSIKVEYTDVEIADDIIEVAELEITLAGNEVREVSLDYSSDVAYAVIFVKQCQCAGSYGAGRGSIHAS